MKKNPLSIIKTDTKTETVNAVNKIKQRKQEAEAKYERIWLTRPKRFDPNSNAIGRERIKTTLAVIEQLTDPEGLEIIDIGCGCGPLARALAEKGAKVTASDIAQNALKRIPEHPNIEKKQDALPITAFEDDKYDLCLCAEVIAELDHRDFRLAIAELCRVIKPEGQVLCSTPIDIYSEDAFDRFAALAETEFKIHTWMTNHYALYLKMLHFFKAPSKFFNAWHDKNRREEGFKHRHGLYLWWFKINSTTIPALIWAPIKIILSPLVYFLEQNRLCMKFFEKLCRFFQQDRGISHATFIGKRRPILEERHEPPIPDRPPFKKEIKWE
jgi:2-polyprenyl-3-methyl-5-hydroxy-6-metoxy-1,4-benzoquinol methylase